MSASLNQGFDKYGVLEADYEAWRAVVGAAQGSHVDSVVGTLSGGGRVRTGPPTAVGILDVRRSESREALVVDGVLDDCLRFPGMSAALKGRAIG